MAHRHRVGLEGFLEAVCEVQRVTQENPRICFFRVLFEHGPENLLRLFQTILTQKDRTDVDGIPRLAWVKGCSLSKIEKGETA